MPTRLTVPGKARLLNVLPYFQYSHDLNRVFLCMMAEMAVQFSWDWDALNDRKLWVRATTILARSEQQEARVLRCFNHRVPSDGSNRGNDN